MQMNTYVLIIRPMYLFALNVFNNKVILKMWNYNLASGEYINQFPLTMREHKKLNSLLKEKEKCRMVQLWCLQLTVSVTLVSAKTAEQIDRVQMWGI